jgi:hypothetical protein
VIISVDIVKHGAREVPRVLLDLKRAARDPGAINGMEFARMCQTGDFHPRPYPKPSPARNALVTAWTSEEALDEYLDSPLAPQRTFATAQERCHVRLQPVRAKGDWRGFSFDTSGAEPLDDDEPMVAMIHGVLKVRYARAFYRAGAHVVAQAEADPSYTGGIALADTPMTTMSFSFWRTAAGARHFAFTGPGPHGPAAKESQVVPWHKGEDPGCFVRCRPLRVDGTISGRDPMGERVPVAA